MTLLKRITFGMVALFAIIVVMGVLAISQLDLNQHKQRIEQIFVEQTGRELTIDGRVNANVFPRLGLSLQNVSMSNAAEFTDNEFASVQLSELQVAALPLMLGKVKIKSVLLQGLSLNLQRAADGKTNWDDLMATTGVVATETDGDIVQEVEAGTPVIAALSVGNVQVIDANISYSDERDGSYLALNDLNLSTGAVVLSEPFGFESDFSMIHSAGSGLTSVISARGEIAVDLANNIYRLEQLRLSTVNSGAMLPVEPLPVSFNGELIADLNTQSVDVLVDDGLLSGVPVSGEFHVIGGRDDLRLTGNLSSGEFDAAPVLDQLAWSPAIEFRPDMLHNASVSAQFEKTDDSLFIQDFSVSISDIDIAGDFQITNLSNAGVLSGELSTNSFNPAPWVRSFGLPVKDGDAVMQKARVAASVRQSGQLLSFNQLRIELDQSSVSGDIEISDIKADNPPVTFALAIDDINLDRYLVQGEVAAEGTTSSNDDNNANPQTHSDRTLIPVDQLRRLNLEGETQIEKLTLAGMVAQNVVLPLTVKEGRIEVIEAKAEVYAGSFFSTASLDLQADEPRLTVAANLNGVDTQSLLEDKLDKQAPLTGVANINVDLLSRGLAWKALQERANGVISVRITDGQLSGIDIPSQLRDASRLSGNQQGANDELLETVTDFSELSLSAVVADGVMQSDDLVFISPYLRLNGEGGIYLNRQSVDYLLHLRVLDAAAEQGDALARLAGIELTLPVSGPYDDISVDFTDLLINAFETALTTEIKSRLEDLPSLDREGIVRRRALETEALKQRLEKEQQDAAAVIREKRQQAETEVDAQKQQLESQIEQEKDALKEKLQDTLKKGLDDLLGEN